MIDYDRLYRVSVGFAVLMSLMNALGSVYDIYYIYYPYSFFVHFVGGLFMGSLLPVLFRKTGRKINTWRVFAISVLVVALWEIMELTVGITSFADYDYWFNNGLDMFLGVVGAMIMYKISMSVKWFKKKNNYES